MTQLSPLSILKRMNFFMPPNYKQKKSAHNGELIKNICMSINESAGSSKPERKTYSTKSARELPKDCCAFVVGGGTANKPPRVTQAIILLPIPILDDSQG
ncbi:hypothetical protein PA25_04890 [Pseudoalteromonas sp. A25]|uniref:hypothetical protein n=1 Tax=Pseudoalteromonas sp. A25 TaxID=116092 RepID=UPI0012604292|nr:hypothetical protein [Pseudoalteromonas sp. A25]BBN80504.1 hypothetical protein PA25_04890 [Pseudoalteromonas sp. A25]